MPPRRGPVQGKGTPRTRLVRAEARKPALFPAKKGIPQLSLEAIVTLHVSDIIEDPMMDVKVENTRVFISTDVAVQLAQLNAILLRTKATNMHLIGRADDLIIVLDF